MKTSRAFLASFLLLTTTTIAWTQEMPVHEWGHNSPAHNTAIVFWPHFKSTTDVAGNVYVAGEMRFTFDADPGPGVTNMVPVNTNYTEVYVIKYNASGTFAWARKWGTPGRDYMPGSLIVDPDGNVFVDIFMEIGFNQHHTSIVKLDVNGNELWAKQINTNTWGGRALAMDQSGNLLIAGGFGGTVDFDPNAGVQNVAGGSADNNLFLLNLDTDGNFVWVKNSTGVTTASAVPTAMSIDPSGNILITGHFNDGQTDFDFGAGTTNLTSAGTTDIFVLKLEPDGDFQWVKQIGGTQTDYGLDIAANASGDIFITGLFNNTVDFDPDAGVFSLSALATNRTDGYLLRLNPDGTFDWVWQFGSTLDDSGRGVSFDAAGNILVAGQFQGTVDFDPGAGITNLTSGGGFFLKMTDNRELIWARTLGNMATSLRADNSGMVTAVGWFVSTIDADLGICHNDLTAESGWQSVFAVKMSIGTEAQITASSFSPASGTAGTTVVINGTNFGTDPSDLDVRFSNNRLATLTAVTPTQITTTVPTGASTGIITIKYKCFSTILVPGNFVVGASPGPTITNFTPTSGAPGTTVTITGTNFSTTPANNTVRFNGTTAVVTASTATSITTTVPAAATTGVITVIVNSVTATSASNFTVTCPPAPTITSFTPTTGVVGTSVTITGTNFNPAAAVKFNGIGAIVMSATSTSIVTTVPSGATPGPISVSIGCASVSSAVNFNVYAVISIDGQPGDATVCQGETATFFANVSGATNITHQWEYSPDGITAYESIDDADHDALEVGTSNLSAAGFYRCVINGNLASPVTSDAAELVINPRPAAPTVVHASRCGTGILTLGASGAANGEYIWYTSASGGTAIAGQVNGIFITPSLSVTTIYYVAIGGSLCESERIAVTGSVNALPVAPVTNGASACPQSAMTLTASGGATGQYKWYEVSTGGSPIAGVFDQSYTTPILTTTTTYFVSVTTNACEGPRAPVVAAILTAGCAPEIETSTLTTEPGGTIVLDLKAMISTVGTLDINSITIVSGLASGANAVIENGVLTITYSGTSFTGVESVTIQACNTNGVCSQQDFNVQVVGELTVYNAVSPNGDGKNDTLTIEFIELLPDTRSNRVLIFNRWGDEVFSVENYNNTSRVFAGLRNDGTALPSGVYFYKMALPDQNKTLTGFLELRR